MQKHHRFFSLFRRFDFVCLPVCVDISLVDTLVCVCQRPMFAFQRVNSLFGIVHSLRTCRRRQLLVSYISCLNMNTLTSTPLCLSHLLRSYQ